MNVCAYRYFVDVVDTKSFTRAGEKNYISQTAVSLQVASLENILGRKLLVRKNREVIPTECGWLIYEKAKEIIQSEDSIFEQVCENKRKEVIRVAVDAAIDIRLFHIIQDILNEKYDENEFWFERFDSTDCEEMLRNHKTDAWLGYSTGKRSDIGGGVLMKRPYFKAKLACW